MLVLAAFSCSPARKLGNLKAGKISAELSLPDRVAYATGLSIDDSLQRRIDDDTITVTIDGHEMILMHAVLDDETGEMVAAQELRPAMVSARFRNVAERHGKVDLEFQITVPAEMQDKRWQLRFFPRMVILGDTLALDRLLITGEDYRKAQLRGYQHYQRFISRIIEDTTSFVDVRNLEIFLQRNIPQAYAFRNDTSFVSDEDFESCFGVTERMAVEHYTDRFARRLNDRRISRREKMWNRYVKSPIVTEHIRLDTVIRETSGDVIYSYVQTIEARERLRKADILLSGEIYEADRRLYVIPEADPLTFYISSLSTLVDSRERYLTRIIERRAEANAAWNIDFRQGRDEIDESLSDNARQMANIRLNLRLLLENESFDMDSITVTSFASPEGSEALNERLCERRAESVVHCFYSYARSVQDSLVRENGVRMSLDGDVEEDETAPEIKFISRSGGENWFLLDNLVAADTLLDEIQKERYRDVAKEWSDQDMREKALSSQVFYQSIRDRLYPSLRTVQFNFYLHRKGMVKDTVHTTVLDTAYMRGVKALSDRHYEEALKILMPYNDYNTAIAYVSLDRNVSAMSILRNQPPTARVNYMLAILYARQGDVRKAVQHYLTSCSQEPSFVHRGNLDPEIAELIKEYGLNSQ